MTLLDSITAVPEEHRRLVVASLSDEEKLILWRELHESEANPYFRYRNDAAGFVRLGLGESTWSKQDEILDAIHQHRKVVVAASHSTGKSYIASRAAGAVALSWPADMVRVQTTATNFRQVKGILWPYINRMHTKYNLPGEIFTTSWKIGAEEIGVGFSAGPNNEAAISGFHAAGELFLIVDEGGGIHPVLGTAFNNILTGTGHALVIGNFPTDSDDTWFNRIWNSSEWHHIRISAFDTPNFPRPGGKSLRSMEQVRAFQDQYADDPTNPEFLAAYENVGVCTTCPPTIGTHTIAKHLTDQEWVTSIENEFGVDSSYYRSRVLAEESKDLVDKTLPMTWLERAIAQPEDPAAPGAIKLGCDIAADGGDEFVIARLQGWRLTWPFARAGAANQNTMDVAGVILQHIHEAMAYHELHDIKERVRVKIDEIGVGRGVSDRLKELGKLQPHEEGWHNAVIIGVSSSRAAHDTKKFRNQRSEMWWTIRELIQPDPKDLAQNPPLEIELEPGQSGVRTLKQLNAPKWGVTGSGQTLVDLKSTVKKETGQSPDRADAGLLAVYEPPVVKEVSVGPLFGTQTNYWAQTSR